MRFLILIVLTCQVLRCHSKTSFSALSCILHKSNDNVDFYDELSINRSYNVIDDHSLESKIDFLLYTQQYPKGKELIFRDAKSLKNSGFDKNFPTHIITHGFNGRGLDNACMGPMKAFLSKKKFNIIIMDWSRFQSKLNYFESVKKVKPTGLYLGEMISFLEEHGMNTSTTTLIGHSLGAHVIGIAGYNSKSRINHVVALDPAEPSFENKEPGERVSREDATHVEILHSNSGHCGMKEAIGHYDFYPNGGSRQPGCTRNSCSHSRSVTYYVESITSSDGFYGKRCTDPKIVEKDDCIGEIAMMGGLGRNTASPGSYFVETNSDSPYAKGQPNAQVNV